MRAKSSKQRCPALCILWLELLCSCSVGGWSSYLTVSGSRYDFQESTTKDVKLFDNENDVTCCRYMVSPSTLCLCSNFWKYNWHHKRIQDFWFEGLKTQITCNDIINKFGKKNFLWGKDIRRRGLVWQLSRILLKGESSTNSQKVTMSKLWRRMEQISVTETHHRRGLGATPPTAGPMWV